MHLALIAVIGALAAAPSDEAPAPAHRDNVILFQPGLGGVAVAYTRSFAESWAVTGALGFNANISELFESAGSVSTNMGASLDLGLTRYLFSRAPVGPWVGMRVGANQQLFTLGAMVPGAEPLQGRNYAVRGAALLGFTAVLEPGFTIQLAAGPELVRFFQQVDQPTGLASTLSWNLQTRTELGVGWSF